MNKEASFVRLLFMLNLKGKFTPAAFGPGGFNISIL